MVYLILAIVCSTAVSFVMRLSTGKVRGRFFMLAANYLTCTLVAACFTGFDRLLPGENGLAAALGMGAVNGVLYLVSFVLFQRCVARSGMVLSSTFMKLGLLVPVVLSLAAFGEWPTAVQLAGVLPALVAIVLVNTGSGQAVGPFEPWLMLLLLTNGGANAMSKVFEHFGQSALSSQFLLYTFLTAFVLCMGLVMIQKEKPDLRTLLYGVLIGIPNYFSARFLLLSLRTVPGVIAYPTYSAAGVALVSLLGVAVFRERLTKRQWLAVGLILCALILLNL